MPSFGGLFPYPYTYMAAAAAAASGLPACSASTLGRNAFLSSRPRLRFNPYQIPTSLHPTLLSTGLPGGAPGAEVSKSSSPETSPVLEHRGITAASNQRMASPKTSVKDSTNELQNIQRLVRGLEKTQTMSPDSPK